MNINLTRYQKNVPRPPHSIWTNPIHFITCGFGIGAFPFFPGTVATAFAIPLVILLSHTAWWFYLSICCLMFLSGIYLCGITNRDFGTDDHPAAVWDEIATFPIAMLGIPVTPFFLLIAFVLFRFFDIVKPGPIRWVDKNMHSGFGVMLDDLLAALATLILMHALVLSA